MSSANTSAAALRLSADVRFQPASDPAPPAWNLAGGPAPRGTSRALDTPPLTMSELKRQWGFKSAELSEELWRLEEMNHVASAKRERLRAARL